MKYRLALLALCLLSVFSVGAPTPSTIVGATVYPDGDPELAKRFVEYNYRWFNDALPVKSVEIDWGKHTGTYYTNYDDEGFRAGISVTQKVEGYDNWVCMELLHEMVHLKLAIGDKNLFAKNSKSRDDSPEFQRGMLGLAKKGAFANCW